MMSMAYSLLAGVAIIGVVVGAVIGLFAIHIFISHRLWNWRTFRQMRLAGRLMSRSEFERELAAGKGTVVFEFPTLGWRVLRVWWTDEDVWALGRAAGLAEQSPDPEDKEGMAPSPFECWCHDAYVVPEGGRASLVPLSILGGACHRFQTSIQQRFPGVPVIHVRSELVHLFRADPSAS